MYVPGKDHQVSDALSRWAYPAGLEADVSFHGAQNAADYAAACDHTEDVYDDFPLRVTGDGKKVPRQFYFRSDPRWMAPENWVDPEELRSDVPVPSHPVVPDAPAPEDLGDGPPVPGADPPPPANDPDEAAGAVPLVPPRAPVDVPAEPLPSVPENILTNDCRMWTMSSSVPFGRKWSLVTESQVTG